MLPIVLCGVGAIRAGDQPVARWHFDEGRDGFAVESGRDAQDELQGYATSAPGVRGTALRCDGFTSRVVRKAAHAPRIAGAFSVVAWIAPQEYSWNWTGIVDHDQDAKAGYFLGIDHLGRIGFHAALDGRWQGCVSEEPVPLLKWSHVAGTFDPDNGFAVYIDGRLAGRNIARGKCTPAENLDLLIGMSRRRQSPALTERKPSRAQLSPMVFDGLIDEVKIYDRALSAEQVRQEYASVKPAAAQPLQYRKMPSGPPGTGRFGAFYTRLKYCDEWERLWRVGDRADILVRFDLSPVRMVFWRGTGYCPAWVTDNDKWVCDQGPEGRNAMGCCEQMSDKRCHYAHVRLIENTDARAVVHWRTASPDITYAHNHVDPDTGWGDWIDEYYYIYPDAVAVRYQEIHGSSAAKMEWQQSELLNQPGTKPQDNVELDAMTVVDSEGESNTFSWSVAYGKRLPAAKQVSGPIQVMNLKSKYRHFVIGETGAVWKPFTFGALAGYSTMPCWNHWPVAQLPNDGRVTPVADRPSSTCLGTLFPIKHKSDRPDMMFGRNLYGMTDKAPAELAVLARSWNDPAELTLTGGGFENRGYDKNQRAYVLVCRQPGHPRAVEVTLAGNSKSPVLNPALVIKNWGDAGATVSVDGKRVPRGTDCRVGHLPTLEAADLVVWIQREATRPVVLRLEPASQAKEER
jgi:hypothetical protein